MCLSLLNCKTFNYSSVFKKNPNDKLIITKEISNNPYYQEEIVLKNNFRILLKQSSLKDVRICLYLYNSPLYQTQLNSGIEKLILLYVKNSFIGKIKEKLSQNPIYDIDIFSNKDISSLSFSVKKESLNSIFRLFNESLKISKFNKSQVNEIKNEQLKIFRKLNSQNEYFFEQRVERHVFKGLQIQIPFEGNLVSLRTINAEDILKYYINNFNSGRMLLLITGDINNKDFNVADFTFYENNFISRDYVKKTYNKIESSFYNIEPAFFDASMDKNTVYLSSLYQAPSFLNDDFFSFYIANKILKSNFENTFNVPATFSFSTEMINSTNYGRFFIKIPINQYRETLMTFKKDVIKEKQGEGLFYYYGDNSGDIVRDFNLQKDEKIVSRKISQVLDQYKKEVIKDFDFSNIDTVEYERKLISLYFLIDQFIEISLLEERINSITDEDISRVFEKYFNIFAWNVFSDKTSINSFSKDYF
jgi:predicted Zn-dependent peptidase